MHVYMCVCLCESVHTNRTLCGSGVQVMHIRAMCVCHCIGMTGEL